MKGYLSFNNVDPRVVKCLLRAGFDLRTVNMNHHMRIKAWVEEVMTEEQITLLKFHRHRDRLKGKSALAKIPLGVYRAMVQKYAEQLK